MERFHLSGKISLGFVRKSVKGGEMDKRQRVWGMYKGGSRHNLCEEGGRSAKTERGGWDEKKPRQLWGLNRVENEPQLN